MNKSLVNHGIRARVLLLALLPLTLVALGLAWYSIQARQADIEHALEERALATVRQLAQACEFGLFAGERDALRRLAGQIQVLGGARAVTIVDGRGQELMRLGQPRFVGNLVPNLRTAKVLDRDARRLLVAAPVLQMQVDLGEGVGDAQVPLGYVALEISREETLARQRQVLRNSLAMTAFGLALAALLAWRLGRDIVQPIGRLTAAVERIGNGDLDVRVDVETGGEFVVLEQGINRMVAELKASYADLQEKIRAATEELAWRADHDPLTGLLNRAGFGVAVHRALEEALSGRSYSLLYLDLDRFKQVNDSAGHAAGDALLRQLAGKIAASLRVEDWFGRLGGDEFAILLADCDPASAASRAQEICRYVSGHQFIWGGRLYQVAASIGVVSLDLGWADVDKLMNAADTACYAAKNGGRNQAWVYRVDERPEPRA